MGTVVGKLGGGRTGGEDVLALAVSRSSGRAGGTGKLGVATGGTSRGAGSASGQVLDGRGNCDVKHMGGGWGGGLEIILCRTSLSRPAFTSSCQCRGACDGLWGWHQGRS